MSFSATMTAACASLFLLTTAWAQPFDAVASKRQLSVARNLLDLQLYRASRDGSG